MTAARSAKTALALVAAFLPALAVHGAQAGGPRAGALYVALGDSYAAGEGLGGVGSGYEPGTDVAPSSGKNTNQLKNTCHRSLRDAYGSIEASHPLVLPSVPDSERANWACSGARSTDMMTAQGKLAISDDYYQDNQPAQTAAVNGSTKWISLSAGGNDLEFSKIAQACVVYTLGSKVGHLDLDPDHLTCAQRVRTEAQQLPELRSHLTTLYEMLLNNAPHAVLAVVGYPKIFPSDYSDAYTTSRDKVAICVTNSAGPLDAQGDRIRVGFPVTDATNIDATILHGLNSTAAGVVRGLRKLPSYKGRVIYADPYDSSDDVPFNCTGSTRHETVAGFELSLGLNGLSGGGWKKSLVSTATFHPTKDGQQVLARAVEAAFEAATPAQQATKPTPATTTQGPTPSASYSIGSPFNDYCAVAWPTAPTRTTQYIQMTMTCSHVPESEFLFTSVVYANPNLNVTPSTGQMHVIGKVVDVAQSSYGFRELVVQATSIQLP